MWSCYAFYPKTQLLPPIQSCNSAKMPATQNQMSFPYKPVQPTFTHAGTPHAGYRHLGPIRRRRRPALHALGKRRSLLLAHVAM